MISLILPYWNRQRAADVALSRLRDTYAGMDLEVVVVDDGSTTPFVAPDLGLNIRVVRLPEKMVPGAISAALNAGAAAASGDILVISACEVLHDQPVLEGMAETLERTGPKGYVLAAAWCPEQGRWHCHSTVQVPHCPPGSGIAVCAMIRRDFYFKVGGFDEDYCDGAGWEDKDFINRLARHGAQFVIRDDLVVTHPKTGATIRWGQDRLDHNKRVFLRKWAQS